VKLLDRDGLKADAYVRTGEDWSAPAILVPVERLGEALAARRHGQRVGVELPNSSPAAWEKVHWNTIRNLLEGLGQTYEAEE